MNYEKIYDNIIIKAKQRGLKKRDLDYYTEKHHIVPRCLGGLNNKENLVLLTGREHYLCHWLLWKINNNNSLLLAYHKMVYQKRSFQERNFKISSKQYEILTNANSERMKKNNPSFNPDIRKQITITRLNNIHNGSIKPVVHSEETKARFSKRMKKCNPMHNSKTVDKVKQSLKIFHDTKGRNEFIGPKMPQSFRMTFFNPMKNKDLHDKSVKTQLKRHSDKRIIKINELFDKDKIDEIIRLYKDALFSAREISKIIDYKEKYINYVIIEFNVMRDELAYKQMCKTRLIDRMKTHNPGKKCSDPACGTSMCG